MSEAVLPYQLSTEPTGTHMLLVGAVNNGSKVLDVGCATGYLGQWLREKKQVQVWGIEPSAEAAQIARLQGYEDVFVGGIESVLESGILVGKKFDHILLGDVLEHLLDPVVVLQQLSQHLVSGGTCIISVPNVAHYSVRLGLLFGRWNMTETGILDRTHLHFYTRKTILEMVQSAGLVVKTIRPRGDIERWFAKIGLGRIGQWLINHCPGWWAIQNVVTATKI